MASTLPYSQNWPPHLQLSSGSPCCFAAICCPGSAIRSRPNSVHLTGERRRNHKKRKRHKKSIFFVPLVLLVVPSSSCLTSFYRSHTFSPKLGCNFTSNRRRGDRGKTVSSRNAAALCFAFRARIRAIHLRHSNRHG